MRAYADAHIDHMQIDRDAVFPFENYADLRAAGLLKICVPRDHGGLGADFATYVMVAAEIGRHCGATALTWNMHICSTMWTGVLADGIPMSAAERAEHEARRPAHFARADQCHTGQKQNKRKPKRRRKSFPQQQHRPENSRSGHDIGTL